MTDTSGRKRRSGPTYQVSRAAYQRAQNILAEAVSRASDNPRDTFRSLVKLPCPFCGGANIYAEPDEVGSGGQWVMPVHIGCSAKTGCGASLIADGVIDAVRAWNRRTESANR